MSAGDNIQTGIGARGSPVAHKTIGEQLLSYQLRLGDPSRRLPQGAGDPHPRVKVVEEGCGHPRVDPIDPDRTPRLGERQEAQPQTHDELVAIVGHANSPDQVDRRLG
ncbi:MAG: hypothetical protein CVT62_08505 [Actinobacteria bacterium HGW-Actinobacteria-2]|nr:MAG: hypothetical protein CVT62_08505 [Actinobacteria bacterium HGW-Actinobacteria-2]